jgi:uncharacterized protein YbjT (DUF2867 family)
VTAREPVGAAIVTGATGLVGRHLLPLLAKRGIHVQAISRRPPSAHAHAYDPPGASSVPGSKETEDRSDAAGASSPPFRPVSAVKWRTLDLGEAPRILGGDQQAECNPRGLKATTAPDGSSHQLRSSLEGFDAAGVLIHSAPLWLLPPWLPVFADLGVRRLVAFSSTSRFTKEASRSSRERAMALRLGEAEGALTDICRRRQIHWTVFRPTLIYGGGRDRNVSEIARLIARLGFFAISGPGRGLRQPVCAEDLAGACLDVIDNPATYEQSYEMPGGETLTYADMVARIARGVGRRPRLLHLPVPLLRAVLTVAGLLPGYEYLTPEMANRMNEDLVFDSTPARRDFGYDPAPFRFTNQPVDHES